MDTRLQHAVAVARHASFSRAAEAVGVTQSAVTKNIADLERQVGFALFNRTSKGAFPTEEGRDFLDRAARLLIDAKDLLSGRRPGQHPYQGCLRLGIYPGYLEWLLTSCLGELVRRHPAIRLEVNTGSSQRGLKLLNRGDIDAAIGLHEAFLGCKDVDCTPVGKVKTRCFVRHGHPLLGRQQPTVDDKLRYGFVSPSMSAPYEARVREDLKVRGMDVSDSLHIVDFYPLVQDIVAQSDTIGITCSSLAGDAGFKARFALLDEQVDAPSPTHAIGLATRSNWPSKPVLKALRALLLAHLLGHEGKT